MKPSHGLCQTNGARLIKTDPVGKRSDMSSRSRASSLSPFRRFNSLPEIIRLAVMMYVKFPLSLRNVEDLLFERGIDITHETIRYYWNGFGAMFAGDIRRQRSRFMRGFRQWCWHLDEMVVKSTARCTISGVPSNMWARFLKALSSRPETRMQHCSSRGGDEAVRQPRDNRHRRSPLLWRCYAPTWQLG